MLEKLTQQLSSSEKQKLPPVELWDPPYCGEIDLCIKADGSWYYNGTIFKRQSLVKLFASVLKKEGEDYFLVTPVEKVKITVEDAPFVLTQWQWLDNDRSLMQVKTNLDDEFILDNDHPVLIDENDNIYVIVRRNLLAKVHRNVYYQWVDLAKLRNTDKGTELVFSSAEETFCLGVIED